MIVIAIKSQSPFTKPRPLQKLKQTTCRAKQSGTVMSEYLIATLVLGLALFAPIPGVNESAFVIMTDALKNFQANSTYLLSLP